MFDFIKKLLTPQPPPNPPTEKQRRYASKLGIIVTPTTTKQELSEAIAEAERKNPSVVRQREKVKAKGREKEFGRDLVDEELRWNCFAADGGCMLAIYSHRKEVVVDVLFVSEAYIQKPGRLLLNVAAPRVVNDRHIGQYLDWDKYFDLPVKSLLYHEVIDPEFYSSDAEGFESGNRAYKAHVEKGLKIARSL